MKKSFLILIFCLWAGFSMAQENAKGWGLHVGADVVSSYVWRGVQFDATPNIQPVLELSKGGFAVGAWGSYNFTGTYAEPDFYLSYATKHVAFVLNDYHFFAGKDFFNYNNDETGHALEAMLVFSGGDSFPLSFTASTFFYGPDKKIDGYDDETGEPFFSTDNNFSTYIEVAYNAQVNDISLDAFAGVSLNESYLYATDGFAMINLGVKASKSLKITDKFSLPLFMSVAANPHAERMFFVFGFSL